MNSLRNRVTLVGNLGAAPEIVNFEKGTKLAKMRIATNESYKTPTGDRVTETQWHNLSAWGKTAEYVEKYAQKGAEVMVSGKLVNSTYETKEGEKRYKTEIRVSEVLLLSRNEKQA